MKTLLRNVRFLMTLLFVVLVSSCDREDEPEFPATHPFNSLLVEQVSLPQLEAHPDLAVLLSDTASKMDVYKGSVGNPAKDAADYTVLTSRISKAEFLTYEAYSFLIANPSQPPFTFDNYVIRKNHDGSVEEFILRYSYDMDAYLVQGQKRFSTITRYDTNYKLVATNAEGVEALKNGAPALKSPCEVTITVYHETPDDGNYEWEPGAVCQHTTEGDMCNVVIEYNMFCYGGGGGNDTDTEAPAPGGDSPDYGAPAEGGMLPDNGGPGNPVSVMEPPLGTQGEAVTIPCPPAVNELNLALDSSLSALQLYWLANNADITGQLHDFLAAENYTDEAKAFAIDALELMRLNPEIKLDVSRSFNSPFLIDLSEVLPDDDPATAEPDKETLMHVYNKLLETDSFKNLFTDVFGEDSPYTVKFKIGDSAIDCPNSGDNACTKYSIVKINGVPTKIKDKLITIVFDSSKLQGNSFIRVAKTIIHEAIHATLALLEIEDADTPLPYNSEFTVAEFADLLLERFGSDDHLFMANYYLPVLRQNLQEALPLLYSQERIDVISSSPVINNNTGLFIENWNWNNFWEYFPWAGLHNTAEFTAQIGTNLLLNELYEAYYVLSNSFGRDLPD